MEWRKRGIVFRPDTALPWSRSHAMAPTPVMMESRGLLRVFYTSCDAAGVGRPSYVDLDPRDPTRVLATCREPVLDVGEAGTFDDSGVLATSVVKAPDGRLMMYYVGFEICTRIRYRLLTGLAISDDDGATFRKASRTPILERSETELHFRGGPFVRIENGVYRMWYVAGSSWLDIDGKPMPEYRIMFLESSDGVEWAGSGVLVLDTSDADEHGFGRPWIIRNDGKYAMYYSVRRKSLRSYRMGYAESADGRHWKRQDQRLNLDVGPDDYDDSAIMYAAPVEIDGTVWCFYNGNEFGREGFALASRESA